MEVVGGRGDSGGAAAAFSLKADKRSLSGDGIPLPRREILFFLFRGSMKEEFKTRFCDNKEKNP